MTRTCVAIGCTSPVLARGLCPVHYHQLTCAGLTCSVPDCGRPIRASGLCHGHYKRTQRGIPLGSPLRSIHVRQAVIEDLEWIIDTDCPESIARRLGYESLEPLLRSLYRWRRRDLAARLNACLGAAA